VLSLAQEQIYRTIVTDSKGSNQKNEIRLLAAMDERHEAPCGQAIKKLRDRA